MNINNTELLTILVSLVSGGGLAALIKIFVENRQEKQRAQDKEIDDRIAAWQKISDKNESRIERLEAKLTNQERKMDSYERDIRSLERYIQSLETLITRQNPSIELPARPALERDERKMVISE